MNAVAMQHSFVVVTGRKDHLRWLQQALKSSGEVVPVDVHSLERVLQIIDVTGANMAFIEVEVDEVERQTTLMAGLLAAKPLLSIIAMSKQMEPKLLLAVMRAGARDFIVPGGEARELAGLVRKLDHHPAPMNSAAKHGKALALVSARPDSDTVMLALHLALAMQTAAPDTKTLLLDLGVPQGDSLTYLGLTSSYSFVDAVRSLRRIDETLIETAFAKHSSGLSILAMPQDTNALQDITSADVYVLLGTLRAYFPNIVISLGGVPQSDFLHLLLGNIEEVLVVVEQSVPSCQQNMILVRDLTSGSLPVESMRLVVDRYYDNLPPSAHEIAKGFGLPLAMTLPPCGVARLNVMNSGLSMFEIAPGETYAVNVRKLAKKLLEGARSASDTQGTSGSRLTDRIKSWFGTTRG